MGDISNELILQTIRIPGFDQSLFKGLLGSFPGGNISTHTQYSSDIAFLVPYRVDGSTDPDRIVACRHGCFIGCTFTTNKGLIQITFKGLNRLFREDIGQILALNFTYIAL